LIAIGRIDSNPFERVILKYEITNDILLHSLSFLSTLCRDELFALCSVSSFSWTRTDPEVSYALKVNV